MKKLIVSILIVISINAEFACVRPVEFGASINWQQLNKKIKELYPTLTILDLSYKQIHEIPLLFFIGLENIAALHLQGNYLQKVPSSILDAQSLKLIDLSNNRLIKVPNELGELPDLRVINLSNNYITSLPDSLGNLRCLEILGLGFNKLHVLPACVGRMYNLRILSVESNQLQDFSTSVMALRRLVFLNLLGSGLKTIDVVMLPATLQLLLCDNDVQVA